MKKIIIALVFTAFLGGCSSTQSIISGDPCENKKGLSKFYCKLKHKKVKK